MKQPIHVSAPGELREGDTFCGKTVATRCGYGSKLWWSGERAMDSDAKLLSAPFTWHPNGFEVEREPTEPVVWEGVISRYDDLIAQEVYQKLFVIGLGHKHRVTIEEIKE